MFRLSFHRSPSPCYRFRFRCFPSFSLFSLTRNINSKFTDSHASLLLSHSISTSSSKSSSSSSSSSSFGLRSFSSSLSLPSSSAPSSVPPSPDGEIPSQHQFRSSPRPYLMSELFVPRLASSSSSFDSLSHRLLHDAGYIRSAGSGSMILLPMGLRVQRKIEAIIDKHMQIIRASRAEFPLLTQKALWDRSGRYASAGPELMRVIDRRSVTHILSPTHEEAVTALVASYLTSFRDLPVRLYQITKKFRDEARPKGGLLRAKEFTMHDLYTFDLTLSQAMETYRRVTKSFARIFREIQLPVMRVIADTGSIGSPGSTSHEFHVVGGFGQDTLIHCPACLYAANQEKAHSTISRQRLQAARSSGSSSSSSPSSSQDPSIALGVLSSPATTVVTASEGQGQGQGQSPLKIPAQAINFIRSFVPKGVMSDIPLSVTLYKSDVPEVPNIMLFLLTGDAANHVAINEHIGGTSLHALNVSDSLSLLLKAKSRQSHLGEEEVKFHVLVDNAIVPEGLHVDDLENTMNAAEIISEKKKIDASVTPSSVRARLQNSTATDNSEAMSAVNDVLGMREAGLLHSHTEFSPLIDQAKREVAGVVGMDERTFDVTTARASVKMYELPLNLDLDDDHDEWVHIATNALYDDDADDDATHKRDAEMLARSPIDDMLKRDSELSSLFTRTEVEWPRQGEFRVSQGGDACSHCKNTLVSVRSLEVGHVFYLGDKYTSSSSLDACVVRPDGKTPRPAEMGCYGIGVSRVIAALAEIYNDAHGLKFPTSVSPFKVIFIPVDNMKASQREKAEMELVRKIQKIKERMQAHSNDQKSDEHTKDDLSKQLDALYAQQKDALLPVSLKHALSLVATLSSLPWLNDDLVIDDRTVMTPGLRLKSAFSLGVPFAVVVGKSFEQDRKLEVHVRRTGEISFVTPEELPAQLQTWIEIEQADVSLRDPANPKEGISTTLSEHREEKKAMTENQDSVDDETEDAEASMATTSNMIAMELNRMKNSTS